MSTLADIMALGYQVDPAITLPDKRPTTYYVHGFGVATYVLEDDQASIDSIANPVAHAERKFQYENPTARPAIL